MKKSKIRVALGIVMAVVMIFTAASPAFAAGSGCSCGHDPVVCVLGFNSTPLIDANGKQVFSPDKKDIAKLVVDAVPYFAAFLRDNDLNALLDGFLPLANNLFAPIRCDENGEIIDKTVHAKGYDINDFSSYQYSNKQNQNPLTDLLAEEIGGDHVYQFSYDWRKSPFEIADELNTLIQQIKKETGHDKVAINGQSMGTCIVHAYLTKYGRQDVRTVAMLSGAYTGVEMLGQLFMGNIVLDPDMLEATIAQAIRGSAEYGSILEYLPIIDAVIEKIAPLLDSCKDRLYKEFVIPTFGYLPSMWCFVPIESYSEAKEFMLADASWTFKSEVDLYNLTVARIIEERTKVYVLDKNINYFCVSHYNRVMAPVTPAADWDSDGVIETTHTSGFARVALFGETLGDGYVQEKNCHTGHVSPDNKIDASVCYAPENTWFIKNADHVYFTEGNSELFAWLMTADRQYDVRSNPLYPQFMMYNRDADYLTAYISEFGDVDLNGKIDLVDSRLALRHSLKRQTLDKVNLQRADMNFDGSVTRSEAVKIAETYASK